MRLVARRERYTQRSHERHRCCACSAPDRIRPTQRSSVCRIFYLCFFFFQAEDGIRDESVTGVQTCALPIEGYGIRDESVTGVQTCALPIDRKSTRLNSSHTLISYAVFCLDRKS